MNDLALGDAGLDAGLDCPLEDAPEPLDTPAPPAHACQRGLGHARRKAGSVATKLRTQKARKAVELVDEAVEEKLAYYTFPGR